MTPETRASTPRPSLVEWICLVAGIALSVQYAWLLDDAFVYFRYVDNLVHLDLGLVYNRGEFVEGYSSPLWALLLIALRAAGFGFWIAVRLVAVLAFAGTWWTLVRSNRLLSPAGARAWNLPLVLLTCNYAAVCYFTSGTESPLVLLCGAAYALYILDPRVRWAGVVVALSPLVRHELALPLLALLAWTWFRQRRCPWRTALGAGAALAAWMLFRIYYYADLFPNTFYLKDQADPAQGLLYLRDTTGPYHLAGILALAIALACVLRARGRADLRLAERAAMLACAGLVVAYVVRIGGDARHFRYLAFPFALALGAGGGLLEHALMELRGRERIADLVGALGTLSLAAFTLAQHPDQLSGAPLLGPVEAEMIHGIADAEHHRIHPALPALDPWGSGAPVELLPAYAAWRAETSAAADEQEAPRLHERIAFDSICWRIYAGFDRRAVQSLGLTEPFLARAAARVNRPAHKKLKPAGRAVRDVLKWWGQDPGRGMFRAAVEAGVAEPWIEANLETLEIIERKAYNRHALVENLALALSFPPPIRGPEEVFGLAEPVR